MARDLLIITAGVLIMKAYYYSVNESKYENASDVANDYNSDQLVENNAHPSFGLTTSYNENSYNNYYNCEEYYEEYLWDNITNSARLDD